MRIKEVIVVEGKDDVSAVKAAVKAEVISTHGFGITKQTMFRIREAKKKCGVIIFTDPDYAGEQIRRRIDREIEGCKHAFLPREEATKAGNIGIENANVESIRAALKTVHTPLKNPQNLFSQMDLIQNDLVGHFQSHQRRAQLGKYLGIGYGNGKQFLRRLNHYGISKLDFEKGLKTLK